MFAPKPPKIKSRTVSVPVKKTPTIAINNKPASSLGGQSDLRKAGRAKSTAAPPTDRYNLTPSNKAPTSVSRNRGSLSVRQSQQRKRKTSPSTPQWADSSSDEDSGRDEDLLGVRKRQKTSSSIEPMALNRCLPPDHGRRIRRDSRHDSAEEEDADAELVHGEQMTLGEWAKDFEPVFPSDDHASNAESETNVESSPPSHPVVTLQYPSANPPERFALAVPRDATNFNPFDDIYFTIEELITHYLPESPLTTDLLSETDGTVRLLKRAATKRSLADFSSALSSFNATIAARLADSTIKTHLSTQHAIPLSLTKRILAQVYQRTVSPHAHLLRRVKDKKTTYGELLPSFIHSIFAQTQLASHHVFVDLGSGVGNVVLQAALQTGAASYGMEIMRTPARFAQRQAAELRARARLYDVALGAMHLFEGDFIAPLPPVLDDALRKADVVLVNNKVFPQDLNTALLDKFLDLKKGCRVVSLESFCGGTAGGDSAGGASGAGEGRSVRNENSIAHMFVEERFESGTWAVSWAGEGVSWFVAEKRV